jgi:hypothetical protein
MVLKFDSEFHRRYVGGEGEVEDKPSVDGKQPRLEGMSVEEILEEYRRYVGDAEAELPEWLVEQLILIGKIKAE